MNQELQALWRVVALTNLILGNPEVGGRIPPTLSRQHREAMKELYLAANKHITPEDTPTLTSAEAE